MALPRVVALGVLAQLTEARLGQFGAAAPSLVEFDSPSWVFSQLPSDQGHYSEPYFNHVLRGLRTRAPSYLSGLMEGGQWEDVAEELEGVEGVVLFEDVGDE